jgi:mannose/fructose-specific phosphotransferase system component IIA
MITNKALIITHGNFAEGIISSFEQIFGSNDHFVAFTNHEKSIPDLVKEVENFLDKEKIINPVFFVDLRGGSCWRVAKQIIVQKKNGLIFSGMNLAMLIQFASKKENIKSLEELKQIIVSNAEKAIKGEP